ncbi:MarR family winged helix-turn-helix transcriptional regulator [Baekduia sp.]|jgi:DNA-binding MarR family transcriptional regulator|uniref:MarR family winged helix-turn-helix transcriptional regulator n=1 Tax=Baekduia sp. TaxID=2600305 RepID=UPI002E011792|nr:MarR family transcriptional regulator [Baekduia sp.]
MSADEYRRRGGEKNVAERAWRSMQDLVLDNDQQRAVSEALDMSFARIKALRRLAWKPMTGRQLADALGTDPPHVSVIVDELEQKGLVERTPHPTDRRAKIVTVTATGRRAAEKANRMLGQPPVALRALPPEELAALDRIVAALLAAQDER